MSQLSSDNVRVHSNLHREAAGNANRAARVGQSVQRHRLHCAPCTAHPALRRTRAVYVETPASRASLSPNRTSFIQAKQVRAALKKARIGPNKTQFSQSGHQASHGRAAWVLRGSGLGWVQRWWPGGRTRLGQGHPPAGPQPSSTLSPLTVKRSRWLLVTETRGTVTNSAFFAKDPEFTDAKAAHRV